MKPFFVLGMLCGCAWAAVNPQLGKVQSVYILPMSNGMDQFLANRLTALGVFQVVADPQKADTVLTDRLGQGFEDKMKELYPAPLPKKAAEKKTEDSKAEDNKTEETYKSKDAKAESQTDSASSKPDSSSQLAPVESTWGRGRGNFFLVDRQTRSVIWSIYERPKSTGPDELSRTATRVVQRLKKDLEPPREARNQ